MARRLSFSPMAFRMNEWRAYSRNDDLKHLARAKRIVRDYVAALQFPQLCIKDWECNKIDEKNKAYIRKRNLPAHAFKKFIDLRNEHFQKNLDISTANRDKCLEIASELRNNVIGERNNFQRRPPSAIYSWEELTDRRARHAWYNFRPKVKREIIECLRNGASPEVTTDSWSVTLFLSKAWGAFAGRIHQACDKQNDHFILQAIPFSQDKRGVEYYRARVITDCVVGRGQTGIRITERRGIIAFSPKYSVYCFEKTTLEASEAMTEATAGLMQAEMKRLLGLSDT